MKTNTILLFIILANSQYMFSQTAQDTLSVNYIYAPNNFNDSFSAEESWEIHKAAYIKQLKSKGLTDDEIKKSIVTYEKDKEAFIAKVKEQQRLAFIQRKQAADQRALADIEREKADELRKLATIQREKADELRKLADIERQKADEQRVKDGIQREKANEMRKLADIQRAKDDELRKLADIERQKADEQRIKDGIQREKANELRKLADIQRAKDDELRKLADIERQKADEQRVKDGIQREKANELRKLADIQRARADEQRKIADIQREKAEEQRKKSQEWTHSFDNILTKNITLSNKSNSVQPIIFNVASKTTLRIGIKAQISSGTTLIEIYNPNGIKEGELSLKSKSDFNEEGEVIEYTSGALDKTILGAEVGEWQITISSQKSEGTVAMSVAQYIKPTIDE